MNDGERANTAYTFCTIFKRFLHLSLILIGRRNRRARRKTVQGAAGQGGDDVRVPDGEGEVGVSVWQEVV